MGVNEFSPSLYARTTQSSQKAMGAKCSAASARDPPVYDNGNACIPAEVQAVHCAPVSEFGYRYCGTPRLSGLSL